MFLAIARKLNLENFPDIPLRPCGTSRYSTDIAEAFITMQLKTLRPVGAFPGFYCPPAQCSPASAIARRSCLAAGSEICAKFNSQGGVELPPGSPQYSSFKFYLQCAVSPVEE